jgi:hypothetical protein
MHDHFPPPQTKLSEARAWVSALTPLSAALVLTLAGWALLQVAVTPTPLTASKTTTASAPSVAPVASPFVVEVVFPDRMTVVTPEPPTPTPAPPKATPVGIDICTDLTRAGTLCKQPKPPKPAPTEVPDCPVDVGSLCVGTGKPVTWLPSPTPDIVTYPPGDG